MQPLLNEHNNHKENEPLSFWMKCVIHLLDCIVLSTTRGIIETHYKGICLNTQSLGIISQLFKYKCLAKALVSEERGGSSINIVITVILKCFEVGWLSA